MIKGITHKIKLNNKKILLAGPWVGEFGWELFCWQGYVRNIAKNFDDIIILGRNGHQLLYADFMTKYVNFNAPAEKANMFWGQINESILRNWVTKFNPTKHLRPFNIGFSLTQNHYSSSATFKEQLYYKYSSDTINEMYDVILHPRNKLVGDNRNWVKEKWQELVYLLSDSGFTVAIIGTDEAYELEDVDDYRDVAIEDTVALFSRCKLVVGTSSGPLHLASLCGTPHLVWSEEFNRIRYEKAWNPFNTQVYFYSDDDWNPSVNKIYKKIENILL